MCKYTDRPVEMEIVFSSPAAGECVNLYAAWEWLAKNGFSYGFRQGDNPIAIKIGTSAPWPEKWDDMSDEDKKNIDGVLISVGGMKYGNVRMRIFKPDFSNLKIGQIFLYEGKLYKVKDDTPDYQVCDVCAFRAIDCSQFNCLIGKRSDKKAVVFVECDKEGKEVYILPVISKVIENIIKGVKPEVSNTELISMSEAMKQYARLCVEASMIRANENIEGRAITARDNVVLL